MAPIRKRASMRARASSSKATPNTATKTEAAADSAISAADLSSLRLKKLDKRHLKHAALMHKVRDASISKSSTKKRRRPGNKLQATESLGGLRDALPEVEEEDGEDEWEGLSDDEEMDVNGIQKKTRRRREDCDGKIKMRSLKHRPGAMKRKQVLERKEQERFARNLAQLAGNEGRPHKGATEAGLGDEKGGSAEDGGGQAQKWAALRAFIGGTLEQDKAFGKA